MPEHAKGRRRLGLGRAPIPHRTGGAKVFCCPMRLFVTSVQICTEVSPRLHPGSCPMRWC